MMRSYLLIIGLLAFIFTEGIYTSGDEHADDGTDDGTGDDGLHDEVERQQTYDRMMDATSTLSDMWRILNCDEIVERAAGKLPIHNASVWAFLRGAYIGAVGYSNSTIRHDHLYGNGFDAAAGNSADDERRPAIVVKHHPQKGRAVYANKPFSRGDVVRSDGFTACFTEGPSYRRFLAALPPSLACDVFEWAYSGRSYGACVDLDEGSFTNHASATGVQNRAYESGHDRPNLSGDVASRDVRVGEELLIDYSEFAELDGWKEMGLGGWDEASYDDDDDADDADDVPTEEEL